MQAIVTILIISAIINLALIIVFFVALFRIKQLLEGLLHFNAQQAGNLDFISFALGTKFDIVPGAHRQAARLDNRKTPAPTEKNADQEWPL